MYVLIGIKFGHYPEEEEYEEEIVALFDTKEAATEYEQKSRLSTYKEYCSRGIYHKQYRRSSLLRGYNRRRKTMTFLQRKNAGTESELSGARRTKVPALGSWM